MSESPHSWNLRPRRWWLAVLLAATPCLVVLAHFRWFPQDDWGWIVSVDATGAPDAPYGTPVLYVVTAQVLITAGLAAARRTRPWALWFLLGALAGATTVLITMIVDAQGWRS
ncbi:hypothetical protein [Jidongwangia harbinensis]|uniref:hypothetical protein n=1 Tax=Jidongwangia harbinensis TaxID=2878561 RepID=UPI001CD9CD12|nr:hypothetical protein [Jidongwangia harbinensis]MCA2217490.1 hypothetical protein [Jidongwangia harbinensis]